MLQLLANFYYDLFFNNPLIQDEDWLISELMGRDINFLGQSCSLAYYLTFICSLISLIIILVLCCLFIGKLVKGVAHLINR